MGSSPTRPSWSSTNRKPRMKATPRSRDQAVPKPPVRSASVVTLSNLQSFRVAAYTTLALAKRGDRLAQNRLMSAAIGVSIVLHAILMAVRFVVAEDRRPATSPPLEVVLVN